MIVFPSQTKTRAWPTTLTRLPPRAGAGGGSRRRGARFPLAANRRPYAQPRRRPPTRRAPRTYVCHPVDMLPSPLLAASGSVVDRCLPVSCRCSGTARLCGPAPATEASAAASATQGTRRTKPGGCCTPTTPRKWLRITSAW